MADKARFGPAGTPINFKGPSEEAPSFIGKLGLDLMEYQAVRNVNISDQKSIEIGVNAEESGVWMTLHAPYYINLTSRRQDVIRKSVYWLLKAAKVAQNMKATHVVFHPGYYSGRGKELDLKNLRKGLSKVIDLMMANGIKKPVLSPETTGRRSQIGTLEELLNICQGLGSRVALTVDFAHLHARSGGKIRFKDDYLKIMNKIEGELGKEALDNLHIHFTEVVWSEHGEKYHVELGTNRGPPFKPLAELIAELGLRPTIVSESPLLDLDAIKMKKIYLSQLRLLGSRRNLHGKCDT